MVKCPKCKKPIDYLVARSNVTATQTFCLEQGYPDYTNESEDFNETEYYCPECSILLANNEDEATKILREED